MGGDFVDYLDLLPVTTGFFAKDVHLVVSTRNCKHVSDLAPADFPEGYFFRNFNLFSDPVIFFVVDVSPDFDGAVFATAGDSLVQHSNIVAPGHISDPVGVFPDFCEFNVLVDEFEKVYCVVISTAHEPFGRELELLWHNRVGFILYERVDALHKNGRLGRWTPAYAVYALFVSYEIVNFVQLIITATLEHYNAALSGSRSQNQSILPRSPRDAIH